MPKFDKQLDTWIDEEVEIPSFEPVVNEQSKRVEFKQTVRKATRKTFYTKPSQRKLICNDHFFYPVDKKKCVFRCNKCGFNKIAYPVTYKYSPEDGKLTHRETRNQV